MPLAERAGSWVLSWDSLKFYRQPVHGWVRHIVARNFQEAPVSTPPPPGPPPGYTPSQPPPGYQGGPQRPRRARRGCLYAFLGAAGVVVLLVIIGIAVAVGHNGTKTGTVTTPASSGGAKTTRLAGIGDPVRDGKFQFTVTKITYTHRVGNSFLNKTAQGEYTILRITVTNIGGVAQTLDDSAQYVYDARGRQFSADSEADIYLNNNDQVFLNQINPGNTVRGMIAFDLPKGDKAVKAELHDSPFSGGVTVSLR